MDHGFWNDRWSDGRIGFHLDAVNPTLVAHADALGPTAGRVFVPLCGKSRDLLWLAERGHAVVGVEFVRKAVDDFFAEAGLGEAEGFRAGALGGQRAGRVAIVEGDLFDLTIDALVEVAGGAVDAIYDRAALVAVSPARRDAYVAKLAALAAPGTRLLLVNFVHDMGDGPPFSVPEEELRALVRGRFDVDKVAERDILGAESRFRERGATFMREEVWVGARI